MSDHQPANIKFLQANHSLFLTISHSCSLPPCLISSNSMSLHSLLTHLSYPACTVHLSSNTIIYVCGGPMGNLHARPNNCIPKALRTKYI